MTARARFALAALGVVVLLAAARVLPLASLVHAFASRMAGAGAKGALVYAVVYVVSALAFVPGSLLTLGAGLSFGFLVGVLVVWSAATTAAALAFLIARHAARAPVERWAHRHPRFAAIDAAIRQRGAVVVLLLRLSPAVPFSLSNYLYGLTGVGFVPYVLASAAGMLPGTILYVYLGTLGRAASEHRRPAEWGLLAVGLLATVTVTVVVSRAARKQIAPSGL